MLILFLIIVQIIFLTTIQTKDTRKFYNSQHDSLLQYNEYDSFVVNYLKGGNN